MAEADKRDYYEALGDKFEAYMSDYDVERRQHLIFSSLLGGDRLSGQRVLEIGSGTGRISQTIRDLGGELTVLDVGEGLVAGVVAGLHCEGVVGDALRLPFRDGAFDLIVSSECVEHTVDPSLAIREMCRVCAPKGAVCITTPNKIWYPVLVISQKLGLRKYSGIENWIYPRHAASVMRSEGMTGIRLHGCHLWPFQIRFTRPLLKRLDTCGQWLYPSMINFGILGRKRG